MLAEYGATLRRRDGELMLVLAKLENGKHPLYDVGLPWEQFAIENETRWCILRIPDWVWEQVKDDLRFHRLPALSRSAKNLPQKVKDYLAARKITIEPDDTMHDILVKLTGIEDFIRD